MLLSSFLIASSFCNLLPREIKTDDENNNGRHSDLVIDFTAVSDPQTGLQCLVKTDNVSTVPNDTLLSCVHSLVNICHYSYATQFRHTIEQLCEEYYDKNCYIVFTKLGRRPSNTGTHTWSKSVG